MSMLTKLKNNSIIRGLCFSMRRIGDYFVYRGKVAQCHDSVILTLPICMGNPKNIYISEKVWLGPCAHISALNAKFICKGHCAIAEGLTVHTGNHARVVDMYVTDITEINKPKNLIKMS